MLTASSALPEAEPSQRGAVGSRRELCLAAATLPGRRRRSGGGPGSAAQRVCGQLRVWAWPEVGCDGQSLWQLLPAAAGDPAALPAPAGLRCPAPLPAGGCGVCVCVSHGAPRHPRAVHPQRVTQPGLPQGHGSASPARVAVGTPLPPGLSLPPRCTSPPARPSSLPGLSAPGSEPVLGQGGRGSARSLPAAPLSVPLSPGADSSLLGKDSPPTPTMYKYRPGYSSSSSSAALPHSTSAKVRPSLARGTSPEGMPRHSWCGEGLGCAVGAPQGPFCG